MPKVSDQVFIYRNGDDKPRMIQAKNIQTAYEYATGSELPIKIASGREVASAMKLGVEVEEAPRT